ncbi:MAG: hypothetical protein ACHQYO_07300 [Halanaerobiales bacterium]
MNKFLKKKGIGFYLLVLSGILAIIATARYADWAPANYVMNPLILAVLIIGIVLDLLLVLYDNDYLVVAATACYSVALFQLLADNVGSFVDAFQGIVMFGDPIQVGTILSISYIIAGSILASIIASFTKRVRT